MAWYIGLGVLERYRPPEWGWYLSVLDTPGSDTTSLPRPQTPDPRPKNDTLLLAPNLPPIHIFEPLGLGHGGETGAASLRSAG
jgi:hypothetical protein